jgi:Zn-dependent protease with chaperone function
MNVSGQSSDDALLYSRLRLRWTIIATAAELLFLMALLALTSLLPPRFPPYGPAGEPLIWALISVGGIFAYLFWMFPFVYHLDFRLPRAFGVEIGTPADGRQFVVGGLGIRGLLAWVIAAALIASRIGLGMYWPVGLAPVLVIMVGILWQSGKEEDKSSSREIRDGMDPSVAEILEELAQGREVEDLAVRLVSPSDGRMLAALRRRTGGPVIYLSENLYTRMSPRELKAVLAHELGHLRTRDAIPTMLLSLTPWPAGIAVLWVLLPRIVPNGDSLMQAVKSIPVILLMPWLAEFMFRPAQLAFRRWGEHRANKVALEVTNDPGAFVSAMKKVAKGNLTAGQPTWWEKLFFTTDPSMTEVIGQARRYAAKHDIPLDDDDLESAETDG